MSFDYSDETLLEMYAPVLRFSAGENFFPMNVEDYVSSDTRLYQVENGRLGRVKVWEKLNGRDRLKDLVRIKGREAFLQHVVRNFRSDRLPQVLLMLAVAALVGVMIFSISGLSDAYTVMRLSIGDKLKIYLLGLFIVVWPFIDADGKVHLSLLLNLFGFFFFGTIFSIALGILAITVISGFWVVYLVFRVYIHLQKTGWKMMLSGRNICPGCMGSACSWWRLQAW